MHALRVKRIHIGGAGLPVGQHPAQAPGGQLGAKVFNMQLLARRADGVAIADQEVADFFLDAMQVGAPLGCLPSLEVHVDMWSEQFARVERVAELLVRRNVPLRITLDHSHLVFKMDHPEELALSGLPDSGSREALPAFDRQIKGFNRPDAVLTGVETRTSSPLRITRGRDLQSLNVRGLYPAGEGAGYAGGIMSAGVDGIEVAEALARELLASLPGAAPA